MAKRTQDVPETVHQAAQSAWGKWRQKISSTPPPEKPEKNGFDLHNPRPIDTRTPKERMIAKIKARMKEFPEWYETDPEKVAAAVSAELDRIGEILDKDLPTAKEPVEVWEIPLSVFNWLVDGAEGETFVHGALSSWSSAENFNASNDPSLSAAQRAKLRKPFLEIAPLLLTAVLEEMLQADIWISFAEKFVGRELKFLVMRVQRPV